MGAGDLLDENDACGLAALVRRGEVQPHRAGGRGHRTPGRGQRRTQRGDPPPIRPGALGRRGAPPRRAVPRRAVPAEGLQAAEAGEPHHMGMRALRDADYRAPHRQRARAALPSRRADPDRPDEHAPAGDDGHHRARAVRPDPQPVGPRPLPRRLVGWIGGRRRGRHRARRPRQRHLRLDPHPGGDVRARRPPPNPGPRRARRPGGPGRRHAHRRRHHPLGPRHRRPARRHRRRLGHRAVAGTGVASAPGRRARRATRPATDRLVRAGLQRCRGRQRLRLRRARGRAAAGGARPRRRPRRAALAVRPSAAPWRGHAAGRPCGPRAGSVVGDARADPRRRRRRDLDLEGRRGGPPGHGARAPADPDPPAAAGPGHHGVVADLRPPRDTDDRRARPAPRRLQVGLQPGPGQRLHPGLQRHRPARPVPAARLAGRRTAARRAAGGRLRAGGRADPRRRPARGQPRPGATAAHRCRPDTPLPSTA